jgi:hypothetical protein
MKVFVRLITAAGIGAMIATAVVVLAAPTQQICSGSSELTRINKRFDDLEKAIASLQSQSAKAASDDALAQANNQRQLAAISSQVADLNTTVVGLGRVR